MKKRIRFVWGFWGPLLIAGCASKPQSPSSALAVRSVAFDGSHTTFQARPDYLQMVLPYGPIRELFEELEREPGLGNLENRGEAHITVITPPEFAVLSKKISIVEINEIAEADKIQASKVEARCLGAGQANVGGRNEQTYFVVVRSPDLVRLRARIYERYLKSGGAAGSFDPNHFYPHITLGFTKTDLHEGQGVIKDENSCRYHLDVKK